MMFNLFLCMTANKAKRMMNSLSKFMPNVKGLTKIKRCLLGSDVQSIAVRCSELGKPVGE